MILAGASVDDLFSKVHMRDTGKVIIILSISFLLVSLEDLLTGVVGFSGLLAVMGLSGAVKQKKQEVSKRLAGKFSKLWVGAEMLLFVLVGATVDISYAAKAGFPAFVLVLAVLSFRLVGVFISLIRTNLNKNERLFTAYAYMPKATVQAAIGGLPLAMGFASGEIILTVAVISIIVTAPIGALLIDNTYKRILHRD